jgi:hypothetical protein
MRGSAEYNSTQCSSHHSTVQQSRARHIQHRTPQHLRHSVHGVGERLVVGHDLSVLGEQADERRGAGTAVEPQHHRVLGGTRLRLDEPVVQVAGRAGQLAHGLVAGVVRGRQRALEAGQLRDAVALHGGVRGQEGGESQRGGDGGVDHAGCWDGDRSEW